MMEIARLRVNSQALLQVQFTVVHTRSPECKVVHPIREPPKSFVANGALRSDGTRMARDYSAGLPIRVAA